MPNPTIQDCVLDIPEIQYDKHEIQKIYEQVKQYERIKVRTGYTYPPGFVSKTRVIQYDDHNIPDPSDRGKTVNFLDFDYIRKLVNQFKFADMVHPAQITMISYAEGFTFPPHFDGEQAATVVMFPFIESSEPVKLDFYHEDGIEYTPFANYDDMNYDRIFYTHTYSDSHPTLFNSQIIHGIKPTVGFNVRLKINVPEKFSSVVQKYKEGTLVSVA